MKATLSLVWLLMGAGVCVVISSAVATPWELPKPIQGAVRIAVESTSDLALWWGYGIRERPPEADESHRPRLVPVVKHLRAAGEQVWHGTRSAAAWMRNHATEVLVMLVFLSESSDQELPDHADDPSVRTRGPPSAVSSAPEIRRRSRR